MGSPLVRPSDAASPPTRESDDGDFSMDSPAGKKSKKKKKKEKKAKKESTKRKLALSDDEAAEASKPEKKKKKKRREFLDSESEGGSPKKEAPPSEPEKPAAEEPVEEEEVPSENESVWDDDKEGDKWKEMFAGIDPDKLDEEDAKMYAELSKEKLATDRSAEDAKPASKSMIDDITLSRTTDLAPHCQLWFFKDIVVGSFVRVVVARHPQRKYRLFEVKDAVPTGVNPTTGAAITYEVNGVLTDWKLVLGTPEGREPRLVGLNAISNEKCTEDEFVHYLSYMDRNNMTLMSTKRARDKRHEIHDICKKFYKRDKLSAEDVDKIVKTRERLRGNASVNLVREKLILDNQLEKQHQRKMQDERDPDVILPEKYKDVEALHGSEEAWRRYYEDQELATSQLSQRLTSTQSKLQQVLYGQNSSFGTLASITHRNAQANKGRLEAEDPIDAIVFGRKQGRSQTYWSVNEKGFSEKEKTIKEFWVEKRRKEQEEKDALASKREEELKIGTRPIKDLETFIRENMPDQDKMQKGGAAPLSQSSTASGSTPRKTQTPRKSQKPTPTLQPSEPPASKRRMELSDFLSRK
eukprot:TRINITY_DN4817_c5_g1_i1.p1 TRINITY_DN4817_c5_g1~~TRINITY_DN4817_c5_g1_i1.p1  ORF type:complete len:607 (+),score=281.54 TRINITY_DN4817_c5_g1_i1:79-1821(+)